MRKQILIYALLIFCNLSLTAQNYRSENWYRNYFKEHIEELDPIEGIYSCNVNVILTHEGLTERANSNNKCVIIKEGHTFICGSLNVTSGKSRITFNRIGENLVYDVSNTWSYCMESADSRLYLDNIFGFTYSVSLPTCVIKNIIKSRKDDAYLCTAIMERSFVKDYPTRSMYEQAIANVQRKIEEESQPSSWSGSGWAIGSGYLVTNHHVIDGAKTISIKGIGGDMNTGYSAEVMATDKTNDIAVLKIKDSRFKGFGGIPYAVSSRIADKGEGIFVLGYPMTQVLGNEVKYTAGEINSRTGFQGDVATYQISAPVTHGNSGGPMFDNKGNVIGIVNSGITDKGIAENVGYAIKISYLKILIESAGLNITLPSNNTISTLSKQEKIKRVEKFVYYIECSK